MGKGTPVKRLLKSFGREIMVSWLINLVFGCILEIVTSGFTNGWLWKGEGKRHKEWMASGFLRTGVCGSVIS